MAAPSTAAAAESRRGSAAATGAPGASRLLPSHFREASVRASGGCSEAEQTQAFCESQHLLPSTQSLGLRKGGCTGKEGSPGSGGAPILSSKAGVTGLGDGALLLD